MAEGWKPVLIQGDKEGPRGNVERADQLCTKISREYNRLYGTDIVSDAEAGLDHSVSVQLPEDVIATANQFMIGATELDQDGILRLYRKLRRIQTTNPTASS